MKYQRTFCSECFFSVTRQQYDFHNNNIDLVLLRQIEKVWEKIVANIYFNRLYVCMKHMLESQRVSFHKLSCFTLCDRFLSAKGSAKSKHLF